MTCKDGRWAQQNVLGKECFSIYPLHHRLRLKLFNLPLYGLHTKCVFIQHNFLQVQFYYHMYGAGFTATSDNPRAGQLKLVLRTLTRTITIWSMSMDMGNKWNVANVYIGELYYIWVDL